MSNSSKLPQGYNRTWVSIYTRTPATELTVDGQRVPREADQDAGLFVSAVVVTMEPGAIVTIEVGVEGRISLDDGYRLDLWSPLTARRTPVTATGRGPGCRSISDRGDARFERRTGHPARPARRRVTWPEIGRNVSWHPGDRTPP